MQIITMRILVFSDCRRLVLADRRVRATNLPFWRRERRLYRPSYATIGRARRRANSLLRASTRWQRRKSARIAAQIDTTMSRSSWHKIRLTDKRNYLRCLHPICTLVAIDRGEAVATACSGARVCADDAQK